MKAKCTKCSEHYEFSDKWFENNNVESFVCRKCKIKETTRSNEFRNNASAKSKEVLSNHDVKSRMSQKAIINNIRNSDKISESLKKHFRENPDKLRQISKEVSERWKDPEYKLKISEAVEKSWRDPEYRGKILGSRTKLSKRSRFFKNSLRGLNYEEQFTIGPYTFDIMIENKYLYDQKHSKEKELFVRHNLKNFVYISNLAEVQRLEN